MAISYNEQERIFRLEERPFTPDSNPGERASFYDCFPFEYPGGGNFREPCLRKT